MVGANRWHLARRHDDYECRLAFSAQELWTETDMWCGYVIEADEARAIYFRRRPPVLAIISPEAANDFGAPRLAAADRRVRAAGLCRRCIMVREAVRAIRSGAPGPASCSPRHVPTRAGTASITPKRPLWHAERAFRSDLNNAPIP